MKIYNLKDKLEYIKEVSILEHNEWASNPGFDFDNRINKKINKIKSNLDNKSFCKLLLIDNDNLIGFISIFPEDGYKEYTPWYATMYVKEKYRGNGYSKILNNAVLNEAKNRGFKEIYLKTDLINYYEKFGAVYIKDLDNNEKLYKIRL